jgi:hypothetical protein
VHARLWQLCHARSWRERVCFAGLFADIGGFAFLWLKSGVLFRVSVWRQKSEVCVNGSDVCSAGGLSRHRTIARVSHGICWRVYDSAVHTFGRRLRKHIDWM